MENKQILNKVVKSFKINNINGFDESFVITTSEISNRIDYDQFSTGNTEKLRSTVIGYQPGNKQAVNFTCGEEEIQGVLVDFIIKDTYYKEVGTYYFYQYYFVHGGKGYILSYTSPESDESKKKTFETAISSLSCTA